MSIKANHNQKSVRDIAEELVNDLPLEKLVFKGIQNIEVLVNAILIQYEYRCF
jgi:hypothetical protein